MQDVILILDQDEALAGLIARTMRGQQIYCELAPFTLTLSQARQRGAVGLIVAARHDQDMSLAGFDLSLLTAEFPVLVLGGMVPALCEYYGGAILQRESENDKVTLGLGEQPLFTGMSRGERMLHSLWDLNLSESLTCLATATEHCIGFTKRGTGLYAIQYPIERNDPDAVQLLHNFATLVCDVKPYWSEEYIIGKAVERLRKVAGGGRVLCAVSGGVDSAVAATLAQMAVGDRVICVFVDTGLFRQNEPKRVMDSYKETLGITLAYVDAQESFLKALEGVRTEKDKERVASELLRQVFYKQMGYHPGVHTMVLGTNYNDTLYGSFTQQPPPNDSGETTPIIIEPVCGLFKDEIRRVAKALALPATIVERQPFPASGLALRILGEVTPARLAILRQADAIFTEEILSGGHERRLWQYFTSLSEDSGEHTGYAVVLRASQVFSGEACAARLPFDLLERVTQRILTELSEVRRVVYDMTPSQHYATME